MPTIPSGYANVAIRATHPSSTHVSVVTFGVKNDSIFTLPSQIAGLVWGAFEDTVLPALDSDPTFGPIQVSLNGGLGVITGDGSDSAHGGASINSIPVNGALLVRKFSGQAGRGGRGRYFWPFALNEAQVDEVGIIDGSTVSDHQDLQDDFLEALATNDVPMVILHTGAGTPATVTSLSVQQLIGTQRRRLR